ncbi:MAG: TonB-dependent receptor [Cyanobacteria bacterium P01_H01_bin.58]
MNRTHIQQCLWITGIAWCAASGLQQATAAPSALAEQPRAIDNPPSQRHSSSLAQQPVITITGVQVTATESGLDIVVASLDGQPEAPTLTMIGDALIADIPNAVLSLPEAESVQIADPASGIVLVTVEELPDNQVRIAITGTDAPPTAEFSSSEGAWVLSVLAGAAPVTELEEPEEDAIQVIVTAQKRPEAAQDVPISITVLSNEVLEDAQIDSIEGIANNAPNVFNLPSSPGNFSFYSIRGLGNSNFLSRDAVGFYIDGIPYDSGDFLIDTLLTDLERVEVLRGPQNTLYGRSSSGGVINIITRPPSNELEGQVAATYGNFDNLNLQLSVSDAVIPDVLRFRLAGAYAQREGFVKNTFLDQDVGDYREGTSTAQLFWTPSPDWTIAFIGSLNFSESDGFATQIEPFRSNQDEPGFVRLDTNAQALKITYDNPSFRLNSITSRRFSWFDRLLDADTTSADALLSPLTTETRIWSQEVRLQSPEATEPLSWLLGGYYESRNLDFESSFDITPLGTAFIGSPFPGSDITQANLDQDTYAVFGQVDYQPIEPLTLTVGLRYESTTTRLDRERRFDVPGIGSLPSGLDIEGATQDSSAWLPRFALEYRFNPNLMAYGSISRGYRPAGLNYQTDSPESVRFDAETSWNYELGLKSSWLDDRLTANLAVFTNSIDDYQTVLFDNSFTTSTLVNAEARITGVEAELSATPLPGLDLTAGFGYIDNQFTSYTNPLTGEAFDGNRLPYAPNINYNLAAQYRSPGGFFGRAELIGFGTYFFEESNQFQQDPFALVNARIGYEWEDYGVYVFANNLFDTEYLAQAFSFFGSRIDSYGDRRTVGVQVRAKF